MANLYYKLHQIGSDVILAVADESALGKKYEGNGRILDLQTFRSFYEGELANEQKINELFSECTSANLVGQNACNIAIENNIAKEEHIVDIGGISHIQIYKVDGNKK